MYEFFATKYLKSSNIFAADSIIENEEEEKLKYAEAVKTK